MFSLLNEFLGLDDSSPTNPATPTRLSSFLSPPTTSLISPAFEPSPYLLQEHDAPSEMVRRLLLSYAKATQRVLGEECPPIWLKPERYKGFEKVYEMALWLQKEKIAPYFWALGGFLRWQSTKQKQLQAGRTIGKPLVTWIFSINTTKEEKRLDWAIQCSKRYPGRLTLLSSTHKQLSLEYQRLETQILSMTQSEAEEKIKQAFPCYELRVGQARAHNEFLERVWYGLEQQGTLDVPKDW